MAQVSADINGRQYRMGCDEGRKAHVTKLAQDIDSLIDGLRRAHRRDRRSEVDGDGGAHGGR